MRKFRIIFMSIAALCIISLFACNKKVQNDFEKINKDITLYYRDFYFKNSEYKRIELEMAGMSTEGASAVGYLDGDKLKKITLTI